MVGFSASSPAAAAGSLGWILDIFIIHYYIYLHCLRCSGMPLEYVNIDENIMKKRNLHIECILRHMLTDLSVYRVGLWFQFSTKCFVVSVLEKKFRLKFLITKNVYK